MLLYTFDRSADLGLALVAEAGWRKPRYVAIKDAPSGCETVPRPYLRQMHAVANGVVDGVIVRRRMSLDLAQWEYLS